MQRNIQLASFPGFSTSLSFSIVVYPRAYRGSTHSAGTPMVRKSSGVLMAGTLGAASGFICGKHETINGYVACSDGAIGGWDRCSDKLGTIVE